MSRRGKDSSLAVATLVHATANSSFRDSGISRPTHTRRFVILFLCREWDLLHADPLSTPASSGVPRVRFGSLLAAHYLHVVINKM